MALKQQHIDNRQLAHVAVFLELLADFRPDGRYGHIQRVHGLDLGRLFTRDSSLVGSAIVLLSSKPGSRWIVLWQVDRRRKA